MGKVRRGARAEAERKAKAERAASRAGGAKKPSPVRLKQAAYEAQAVEAQAVEAAEEKTASPLDPIKPEELTEAINKMVEDNNALVQMLEELKNTVDRPEKQKKILEDEKKKDHSMTQKFIEFLANNNDLIGNKNNLDALIVQVCTRISKPILSRAKGYFRFAVDDDNNFQKMEQYHDSVKRFLDRMEVECDSGNDNAKYQQEKDNINLYVDDLSIQHVHYLHVEIEKKIRQELEKQQIAAYENVKPQQFEGTSQKPPTLRELQGDVLGIVRDAEVFLELLDTLQKLLDNPKEPIGLNTSIHDDDMSKILLEFLVQNECFKDKPKVGQFLKNRLLRTVVKPMIDTVDQSIKDISLDPYDPKWVEDCRKKSEELIGTAENLPTIIGEDKENCDNFIDGLQSIYSLVSGGLNTRIAAYKKAEESAGVTFGDRQGTPRDLESLTWDVKKRHGDIFALARILTNLQDSEEVLTLSRQLQQIYPITSAVVELLSSDSDLIGDAENRKMVVHELFGIVHQWTKNVKGSFGHILGNEDNKSAMKQYNDVVEGLLQKRETDMDVDAQAALSKCVSVRRIAECLCEGFITPLEKASEKILKEAAVEILAGEAAATKIQDFFRRRSTQKRLKADEAAAKLIADADAEAAEAEAKVKSKRAEKKARQKAAEEAKKKAEAEAVAVTKIQTLGRRYLARQSFVPMKKENEAAIKIQAVVRGNIDRSHNHLSKVAQRVIMLMRGNKTYELQNAGLRKEVEDLRDVLNSGARVSQNMATDLAVLQRENQELARYNQMLAGDVEGFKQENEKLAAEMRGLAGENEELARYNIEHQVENAKLVKEAIQLRMQNKDLDGQLFNDVLRREDLADKISALEAKNKELSKQQQQQEKLRAQVAGIMARRGIPLDPNGIVVLSSAAAAAVAQRSSLSPNAPVFVPLETIGRK